MKQVCLNAIAITAGAFIGIALAMKKKEDEEVREDVKALKHWVINHPDASECDIESLDSINIDELMNIDVD